MRGAQIDKARASTVLMAGDPLAFDPVVRDWPYWIAGRDGEAPPPDPDAHDLSLKDTTHIAIIDRAGNVFDATPSGGWVDGAVILGETGIGLSTRGEQFWLDRTKAAQLRPRSRPRYTLTPSIVLKDGEPFMAIGTPGGDNQEQTILQVFLNVVEFWDDWYPNLHAATERPRVLTQHFIASFWPHPAGLNKMSAEEGIPAEVVEELKARGHDVSVVRPFSISGCGTVVLLDPRSGSRIAGADPRRDCYAMAY
jgi:gamma-glutamyltranspeptidase/glutathione hydrolase